MARETRAFLFTVHPVYGDYRLQQRLDHDAELASRNMIERAFQPLLPAPFVSVGQSTGAIQPDDAQIRGRESQRLLLDEHRLAFANVIP